MPRSLSQRSSSRVAEAPVRQYRPFDVVRVRRAPPDSGLAEGEQGTIVEIFDDLTFLVDFSGASGTDPHGDDPVHELSADQVTLVRKFQAP